MSSEAILEGGGLRAAFERRGDRIGHTISYLGEDGAVWAFAESVEGTDTEDWPPSPPLREVHIEDRLGGVRVALLVGMAAESHWSISCELDPARRQLTFDVACRVRREPGHVGSRYRTLGETTWDSLEGKTVLRTQRVGVCQVGPEGLASTVGREAFEFADPDATFGSPARPAPWKYPRTIRWRYEFRRLS